MRKMSKALLPDFENMHEWESYSKELLVEYRQCFDEGKNIEQYKEVFNAVSSLPQGILKEKMADALFELTQRLPYRKDFAYCEPNSLDEIVQNTDGRSFTLKTQSDEQVADKVAGGWFGRICGCLLGKPVEGIMSNELKTALKESRNYPLSRYIDREDLPDGLAKELTFPLLSRAYSKNFGKMPSDDDTNYILIAYEVLNRFGRDFTSANVAEVWLGMQTKDAYCTAERVAYRNFINGYTPPCSAEYKNPYREWIGAQIRGDFYGYINPCNPITAAKMAYRDASISHVKNGIYGEMWVATMVSAAYGTDDVSEIISCGLSQIPAKSRLYEGVMRILQDYKNGTSQFDCFNGIRTRWNEKDGYDWCHTISNAEIVTASLLYGEGDYAKSICMAVEQGFDTDCNGATVGSVLGVMLGYNKLPEKWIGRICDTLESTLFGYTAVSVKEMAKKTMKFVK